MLIPLNRYKADLLVLLIAVSSLAGCLPDLPKNVKPGDSPLRTIVREVPEGRIQAEDGVTDSLWLEIDRPHDQGVIGGYLSMNDSPKKTLVILLHGASTFSLDGEFGSASLMQLALGLPLQQFGFMTWALATPECGTPYGQDDLQSVLDAIDWLARAGQGALGIEHVCVAGYSTGGTLAILTSRRTAITAVAAISGLTEPKSIEEWWGLYQWVTSIYPLNEGACQMRDTIRFYGRPGDPRWDALDSVAHIDEFISPIILLQGSKDQLFSIRNLSDMEAQYRKSRENGSGIPEMQFVYLTKMDHFVDLRSPAIVAPIVDFFDAYRSTQ